MLNLAGYVSALPVLHTKCTVTAARSLTELRWEGQVVT